MKDLFEHPELQPIELKQILSSHNHDGDQYKELAKTLRKCEMIGYTFDYYLDAEPYDLRPMQTKWRFVEQTMYANRTALIQQSTKTGRYRIIFNWNKDQRTQYTSYYKSIPQYITGTRI